MTGQLGLIVGSGAPALGLEVIARAPTHTPYGLPSSPILTSEIAGRRILWIARHGEQGGIAPHEINYRANLWALHQHGVRHCIGINVVGTIEEGFAPGDIAVPEQLIDYTWGRESTFGGRDGRVLHAEFAEPFSRTLAERLVTAARESGYEVRRGVYGVTQGPRLETAAEIGRLARDGCTMVGMTAMPEAALARELGMDYAICALAVNYAAGRGPSSEGIHDQIGRYLRDGMPKIAKIVEHLVREHAATAAV